MTRRAVSVWRWPVVMAALSVLGLVTALVDDGAADTVGWMALAIPAAVCIWGCVRFLRRAPTRP